MTCFTKFTRVTQVPIGNMIPSGVQGGTGNAREQISLMLQNNAKGGAARHSRILLIIPSTQSVRRMAHAVIDLKQLIAHLNSPHFHMFSISSVLSTKKWRLCIQNTCRSGGHVLPVHPASRK